MSHFYGVMQGQAGEETRRGSKNSGLQVTAASYSGAIKVELWHDALTEVDRYRIYATQWRGAGKEFDIASGVLGVKP